jgi:hypothetical protein
MTALGRFMVGLALVVALAAVATSAVLWVKLDGVENDLAKEVERSSRQRQSFDRRGDGAHPVASVRSLSEHILAL